MYLTNSICKFTPLFNIDYTKKLYINVYLNFDLFFNYLLFYFYKIRLLFFLQVI